jgi:hypothetical protein
MKISIIRTSSLAVVLLVAGTFASQGATGFLTSKEDNASAQEHLSGLMARITLPNGTTDTVRLDGIGCTESICSRVLIKAKTAKNALVEMSFDSIVAIRDVREDGALFVLKDHSEQRLSLVPDFRVLYLAKEGTRKEKLDLATIKSFEILRPGR